MAVILMGLSPLSPLAELSMRREFLRYFPSVLKRIFQNMHFVFKTATEVRRSKTSYFK